MKPLLRALLVPALVLAAAGGLRAQPGAGREAIWIEGEDAASHTFNGHGWYSRQDVRTDVLSPAGRGDWLAHYANDGRTAQARFAFEVREGGTYAFWLRGSVYRVRQWYRVDGGPQVEMDLATDPWERFNLTAPSLDIRFLAWTRVADLDLAPGAHTLTIGLEVHPAWGNAQVHGGLDALVLVDHPWAPAGTLRPGGTPAPEPEAGDWFPLVVGDDPFSPESITDMRRFLEAPAGGHGPLRTDGARFVFADGTPVRFWGLGAALTATPELQARQARLYAKHGVNLLRLHPVEELVGLLARDPASGERRLDPERLARLDRWFAILKAEGLYMAWSPFYPHVVTPDDGYPAELYAELPARGAGRSTSGFATFVPELQEAEWTWLRALLEHVNPHTGLRYADDPALAILETRNEDSVFWHAPLNALAAGQEAPRHTALLKARWAAWLAGRYADDAALRAAWGPPGAGSRPGDSLANANMPIYGAWEMEADGPRLDKREAARMGDFVRFLAETQRAGYERRRDALRALGFRGVVVGTAWRAGGPAAAAANLWTDDAMEAIDRHGYFGGGEGVHRIVPGAVNDGTHLDQPGAGILASGFEQVEDKPMVLSEWSQSPPNEWKAEIAPLVAFYGLGLGGWDAVMHFSGARPRMANGWPDLDSYVSETPHYLGQFPALSFAVRHGHVAEGPIVAARRLPTESIFRGVDALTQDVPGGGWDPAVGHGSLALPPETFAMGRVTTKVADGLAHSARTDWDALRDPATGVVDSATGELRWRTAERFVEVRGPRTQGVVGFAGGRRVDLPGATVEVRTGFVSLLLTPLDDRPLDESARILVTAMARDRQTGARYSADGKRLEVLGGPPLLLEPVQATITFRGGPIVAARALDVYGVPTDREVERRGNTITIDGRYATTGYEVLRAAAAPPTASPGPTRPPATVPPGGRAFLPRLSRGG